VKVILGQSLWNQLYRPTRDCLSP